MSVRRRALEALMDITDRDAYANLRLKEALHGLPEQDARFVSALVYYTLEHLYYIDHVLKAFVKGRQKPAIRGILRLGACQLLYLNVPDSAVCNESAALTKEVGKGALAGYVNAVMRSLCREKERLPALPEPLDERLSMEYTYPLWLVREYMEQYGEVETVALLSAREQPMVLRAQPPYTPQALREELDVRGIAYRDGALVPQAVRLERGIAISEDPLFLDGRVTVQSESAMLVCQACGVRPGMRVLDTCAAPGGKSGYLAALMENRGTILCWELHAHRAELTKKTLERLHVTCATVFVQDAVRPGSELQNAMDVVLVDAPCSGFGVPGKPDVRLKRTDEDVKALAKLQAGILQAAAPLVVPGGALVYATCTVSRRENQDVVLEFLEQRKDFSLQSLSPYLPAPLAQRGAEGMLQLFPHRDETDGFFMARMVKACI